MKTVSIHTDNNTITCTNCITGERESLLFREDTLVSVQKADTGGSPLFSGPGLIDLQVNGIFGIDFNVPSVTVKDIIKATQYLLSGGVTTFSRR